jgi:hypothetical protein
MSPRYREAHQGYRPRALDSPGPCPYNPAASRLRRKARPGAQVAQLVEHVTENHGVGGSIPPLGTSNYTLFKDDGRVRRRGRRVAP